MREHKPDLGFSIGITIGGVAQIICQVFGHIFIRKYQALKKQISDLEEKCTNEDTDISLTNKSQDNNEDVQLEQGDDFEDDAVKLDRLKQEKKAALSQHISLMVVLFAVACGSPAFMRLVAKMGLYGSFTVPISVVFLLLFSIPFAKFYLRRL